MYVPQGRLDAFEQDPVARLRLATHLANVEVVDLALEDVLKAAGEAGELKFLDDPTNPGGKRRA